MEPEVREYRPEDLDAVLELHERVFKPVEGRAYGGTVERLEMQLHAGHLAYVAVAGDSIVGLLAAAPLDEDDYALREVNAQLKWARDPEGSRAMLEAHNAGMQMKMGGECVLDYFDNEITRNFALARPAYPRDLHVTDFAVNPDRENNGVGTKLAGEALTRVRDEGTTGAIYGHCIDPVGEETPTVKIALSLGFLPILRHGPHYGNGAARLLVGLRFPSDLEYQ